MATRVNRFLSSSQTRRYRTYFLSLCEILIKNINNGACAGGQKVRRQLRDNKRVLAQVTIGLIRKGRINLFQILKRVFYRTCRSNHKKGLGPRPLIKQFNFSVQLHCSSKIWNHREVWAWTHSEEIKRRSVLLSLYKKQENIVRNNMRSEGGI